MSNIEVSMPPNIATDKFGNLELGTPFMFIGGQNVYIKIDEVSKYDSDYHKRDYNTICLNDGRLEWTDDRVTIILVCVNVGVAYKHKTEYIIRGIDNE